PPDRIPELAKQHGCRSVAYTYTDPVVFYEYTMDSCIRAREAGLRNALVTAGYINRDPMAALCEHVDAANIDLKFMSDRLYREICGGTLKPVQETLVLAKSLGVMVEVTNLVIPTLNDSEEDVRALCQWVAGNMGADTPIHFSRFHPDHRMKNLPPTPASTLDRAKDIAEAEGLRYVYIGNVMREDGGTTRCHSCGATLVDRRGYVVRENRIRNGVCPDCGTEVYGTWS
ncbi:MAG: AmmeMemoRadiSam system radical SAM enzyme, partial [bacterium]|nr:AmmeMemoRadiSam system radical SAM enzyme [bacterium]